MAFIIEEKGYFCSIHKIYHKSFVCPKCKEESECKEEYRFYCKKHKIGFCSRFCPECIKERQIERGELKEDKYTNINSKVSDSNKSIDDVLRYLKSQEPNSNNLFFRNSIIGYEWGDLQRSIVYSERFSNNETSFKVSDGKKVMFRDGFKDRSVILSEGKLAMADLLTQLFLLCVSLEDITGDAGWNFNELRVLGANHLEERHKDFKRDGWTEVKK